MNLLFRSALAIVFGAFAVAGCAYLSGYLLRALLGVDMHVAWNTWLAYFRVIDQPAYGQHALAIRGSGHATHARQGLRHAVGA